MTASPKDLYLTMMEIIRKCSEPGAANLHEKDNFQRGRSNKTNHLDWAVRVKSYYEDLPFEYKASMRSVYILNEMEELKQRAREIAKRNPVYEDIPSVIARVIYYADEGLDKWYSSLPAALISQGDRVVAQVI